MYQPPMPPVWETSFSDEEPPLAHSSAVLWDSDTSFTIDTTSPPVTPSPAFSSQNPIYPIPVTSYPAGRLHGEPAYHLPSPSPSEPLAFRPVSRSTPSPPESRTSPISPQPPHIAAYPAHAQRTYPKTPQPRYDQPPHLQPATLPLTLPLVRERYGGSSSVMDDSNGERTYIYRVNTADDIPQKVSQDELQDENPERGNWSGKFDFLLSSLGMAVGLGNVWRFPYLCYRNGGGAFFIPYIIMLVFVGIPLFFLEMSLGQFTSSGPLTCWKFAPLFKGVGVAQLVTNVMVSIYYNMIMAWALFYLVASFRSDLPWMDCDNTWNTPGCKYKIPDVPCDVSDGLVRHANGTCYDESRFTGLWNYTIFHNRTGIKRIPPSEDYYNGRMLEISSGIGETGSVQWELVLALAVAWIITFLCMIKGIKTSGKVVYFTAIFPYFILFILLIRGVTLPNAGEGIEFYLTPQWERLGDARVWYDAAVQVFFSLGLCYGSLIALSSYNRFNNNCLRDALIVSISNCATSVFAGLVIFSYLGYMAGELNTTVDNVATSGPGLAFIVYPDAVSRLPGATFWAIIFFLMVLTLGLDSQFAAIEMIVTCLVDQFPHLRQSKTKVNILVIIMLFLLGLLLCAQSGVYWLQLMDTYCGGWGIMIIGLFECVTLGWIYGSSRLFDDINIMIGRKPQEWWKFCWQISSPVLILFIIIFSWADYNPAKYGEDYLYPSWADALGWLMSFLPVIWIPIIAIYKICREEGTIQERIRYLTLPTEEWGPALLHHRHLVDYVEGFIVDPWNKKPTTKEKSAFQNWGMPYSASQDSLAVSVVNVNGKKWPTNGSQKAHSLGSLEFLPNPSVNPTFTGSQMSIGGISTVSYESGV